MNNQFAIENAPSFQRPRPRRFYRFCSGCLTGHPMDVICDLWEKKIQENQQLIENRKERSERIRNRQMVNRECIYCSKSFQAPVGGKGRPRETCSDDCAKGRMRDARNVRRRSNYTESVKGASVKTNTATDPIRLREPRNAQELQDFLDTLEGGWGKDDEMVRWDQRYLAAQDKRTGVDKWLDEAA